MKNVIVGQSGGPTAVINASLAGVFSMAKKCGADKVYGMRNGIQGLLDERYVLLDDVLKSDLELELLKKTPASFLGSCRFKLPDFEKDKETYEKIFATLKKLEIAAFIYIGGNDSMDTIRKLADYAELTGSDIKFVGAPKTIDNDLAQTDHTPGYGSAAKYVATAVREAIRDEVVYSTQKTIYVVEVMGRNAGWLTAAAALSRVEGCTGPDLIYLPESNFDMADFDARIEALLKVKNNLLIAVSEGIHDDKGTFICEYAAADKAVDAFGHKQMGGTATTLAHRIAAEYGLKTRAVELSTLQRAASHLASRIDIIEAGQIGGASVKAADEGSTGVMVVFERESDDPYQCHTAVKDVHKIANEERLVPRKWINKEGTYVTDEFRTYVEPLIQGDLWPIMVGGIPRHLFLK